MYVAQAPCYSSSRHSFGFLLTGEDLTTEEKGLQSDTDDDDQDQSDDHEPLPFVVSAQAADHSSVLFNTFVFLWSKTHRIPIAAMNSLLRMIHLLFAFMGMGVLSLSKTMTGLISSLSLPDTSEKFSVYIKCTNKKCGKLYLYDECFEPNGVPRVCCNAPLPSKPNNIVRTSCDLIVHHRSHITKSFMTLSFSPNMYHLC